MTADRQTLAAYEARADDYLRLTASTKPHKSLQEFMDELPAGAKVLDIGCGPGTESAHMRAAGLSPDPFDASESMVKHARDTFNLPARIATFDEIAGDSAYDGAWANFSLLHADPSRLPQHISAIAKALRPDGLFHIAMKTGSGVRRDTLGRLYAYLSVSELKDLLIQSGLIPVHIHEGESLGLEGNQEPFIAIRARKVTDA